MQFGTLTTITLVILMCLGFFSGVGAGFIVFWIQFKPRMLGLFCSNVDVMERLAIIVEGWENEEGEEINGDL